MISYFGSSRTSFVSLFHPKAKPYPSFTKDKSTHKNITILQVSIAGGLPFYVQETRQFLHHLGATRYARLCSAARQLFPRVLCHHVHEKNSMESDKYIYIREKPTAFWLIALRHMYIQPSKMKEICMVLVRPRNLYLICHPLVMCNGADTLATRGHCPAPVNRQRRTMRTGSVRRARTPLRGLK